MINLPQESLPFREIDIKLMTAYCVVAAQTIENAKQAASINLSLLQTKRVAKNYAALLEAGKALGKEMDLSSLLDYLGTSLKDLLNCERCTVFLVDKKTRELYKDNGNEVIRIPIKVGLSGRCATSKETVIVDDAYLDPGFGGKKVGFSEL